MRKGRRTMLGTFIISHQASLSSPSPPPGHPPHGKPLALPTLTGGPPKNPHTWLLVQQQLLLLCALTAQKQLQNNNFKKALSQWCSPITSRGHSGSGATPGDNCGTVTAAAASTGDAFAWESRKGALHSRDFQSCNHTSNKTPSSDKLINI